MAAPILAARCACSRSATCTRRTTWAATSSSGARASSSCAGAGHEVRVLTTDHREAEPDPAIAEDPDVHRELRWYWSDHELPAAVAARAPGARAPQPAAPSTATSADFAPDGDRLVGDGRDVDVAARARPRRRAARGRRRGRRVALLRAAGRRLAARLLARPGSPRSPSALTGVPTRVRLERAAEWLFVSAYLRERASAAGLAVDAAPGRPRRDRPGRLFRGRRSASGTGALLCLGRLDPRKGMATAIEALADAARLHAALRRRRRRRPPRAAAPRSPPSSRRRRPGAVRAPAARRRSPVPTRRPTRCSSASSGRSRSGSCRSRRWRSARR